MRLGCLRTTVALLPREKEMLIEAAKKYQLKWSTYMRRVAVAHAEATLKMHTYPRIEKQHIEIIEETENEINGQSNPSDHLLG
jgi:uncharacterized protein (DUF1778 family)